MTQAFRIDTVRGRLTLFWVAVLAAALMAIGGLIYVLLARALSRQREFAVRLALGSSRWAVARLLLAESFMVAGLGAVLGLALAGRASRALVGQLVTWRNTVALDLPLDWRVLTFTALLACVATLVAGVGIAARVTDGTMTNSGLQATVIKATAPVTAATESNTVR